MAVVERQQVRATLDGELWSLFTRFDNGWTGGDSTYSVVLPDGRVAWLFSDTILGPVNPDRSRPRSAPFIHNSIVVQDGNRLTTLYGGTPGAPQPLFTPADGASWYWICDGTVEADRLRIFLLKFVRHGPGKFDWRCIGTDVASLRLPELSVEAIVGLPIRTGIHYGAAILEDEAYTYIYGIEDLNYAKYGHVVRVRRGDVTNPWEYFKGRRWSASPTDSVRMLEASIGNEFSVTKANRGYMLITMDTSRPLREWREIVAYFSVSPVGPWSGRTVLYTASEPDRDHLFVYNALAHPELSREGELLITYNVNSLRFEDLYDDADIYRARFLRVSLPDGYGG